jgi:glycosyltransferase involved in cell wall biosynthesis
MNKKNIILFADPDSIHTKKWVEGWSIVKYDTLVSGLSLNQYDDITIFKASIDKEGGNGKVFFKNIFKFRNILNNYNPSIINAHYLTSYGLIAALIKRKDDVLIISLHGTDVMQTMDKNFIYLLMARYILNKCDILVSVSQTMTRKLLQYFPYLEEKIITQQYGFNIEQLDKFYTKHKSIDVITNRGWVQNSNYEILLAALEDLNISKVIIGYDDSGYAKKLKDCFSSLEQFILPQIPYEQNLFLVAKSKIFVSFTTSDGTSLSILEAMYLGAIPIVTNLETNREFIINGINGFLVSIDQKDLMEKIRYVLSLSEKRLNIMREYNKNLIKERFDMKKNFLRLEKKLQNIKKV